MKIFRTHRTVVSEKVEDTVEEITSIPAWFGETVQGCCDCCGFPINSDDRLSALRTKSKTVMLIHADCLSRLTKPAK